MADSVLVIADGPLTVTSYGLVRATIRSFLPLLYISVTAKGTTRSASKGRSSWMKFNTPTLFQFDFHEHFAVIIDDGVVEFTANLTPLGPPLVRLRWVFATDSWDQTP